MLDLEKSVALKMNIPVRRHDAAANKSVLLWELWPIDERAGALPMMDSILWPLGETFLLTDWLSNP